MINVARNNCHLICGAVLFLALAGSSKTLQAQDVRITGPANGSATGPGQFMYVYLDYNNPGGVCNNLYMRMWEVDSSDNPVGQPKQAQTDSTSSGYNLSTFFAFTMPTQPPASTKRYKITVQICNNLSVFDTTTIFVNSYASGTP